MALPDENSTLKKEYQEEPAIEVVMADEGDGIEVDVVDDTPEEDRGRKPLPEGEAEPTDEEMEEYSEAVKKRISKMRRGMHDERRAKEAANRERDEAVSVAQRIFQEKKALETKYVQGEDAFINQSKEKIDLAMASAKREYKTAYEIGDADAMAEAQEKIATAAAERREAEVWTRQSAQRKESTRQEQAPVVQSQPSQQEVPPPDQDAQDWATKNKWFGENKRMTNVAYAIHDELREEGIDPGADSDKYYRKLNAEMRKQFPGYEWGDAPKKKSTSVVAPVNRSSKTATRVTLTQSQVSLAKRLGLTPVQYAVELAKLEN